MKDNRYQHQPWYIKLWRRRWYLLIPYTALDAWLHGSERWKICWSLAVGITQIKMNWHYYIEEINWED